ncbi:hypothetical protein GQ53DRAFT_744066 [Thozetella sp. PMI_491]|nr:hypothetical protein GQ53DRAFT_744066 [Thozetella sp. PMI_491]
MEAPPPAMRSGEVHSSEEWEAMKHTFIALYIVQGKTLPEVRQMLAQRHSFHATLRQYKTRIIKWGLNKKLSPPQHARNSSSTSRSPELQVGADTAGAFGAAPSHGRAVSFPRTPDPPGHLKAIQAAVYGVKSFYSGVLQSEIDQTVVRAQSRMWNIRAFYEAGSHVANLAAAGKWKEVRPLYGEMLDHVTPMLSERNPVLVVCLLQVCCRFLYEGQGQVLQRFLQFVDKMATVRKVNTHPLRLMALGWGRSGEHVVDLLTLCSKQAVETLQRELGPEHAQTLSGYRALHTAYTAKDDHASALASILPVFETESRIYEGAFMTVDANWRITLSLLGLGELDAAGARLEQLEAALVSGKKAGWGLEQLDALECQMASVRGEILRLKGDPRGEEIIAESQNFKTKWGSLMATRHLEFARQQRESGKPMTLFRFGC